MTSDIQRAGDLRMDMGALFRAVLKRWFRILLVTGVLVGATGGGLMFVPKTYESSASLLVEPRDSVYTRAAMESGGSNSVGAEAMMSSQIELIKSRDLLLDVINSEGLRQIPEFAQAPASPLALVMGLFGKKPAPKSTTDETVFSNLSDHMTVIRERDSAVISIFVRSTSPELAARIANAIAAAHVKRRAGQSLSDTAEATVWLQQQIDTLRGKVEQADSVVAKFKVDNDLVLGSNLSDQQISTVSGQIADAQQKRNDAQSRADLIRGLIDSGQSLEGVADVRNSVVIQSLLQTKASLQGDLAQKSSTLLANHPTIKALKAQIREVEGQVAAEGEKVAESLEAEAKVQEGIEARLRAELAKAKTTAGTATKGGVTLDGLEREAKAQRDLLENYLAKYSDAASRTSSNSALPDVRVISEAAPPDAPSAPKVALIVGAVGFVSLALQIGAILFGELMSGRALVERTWREPLVEIVPEAAPAPAPTPAEATLDDVRLALTHVEQGLEDLPEEPGDDIAHLSAAVAAGEVRIVLLATLGGRPETLAVVDRLLDDALGAGLSAVVVDAGSREQSASRGLSDLASELAEYGDVVQRASDDLAQVPWGRLGDIDHASPRPLTLVEALSDIYHLVLVDTGSVADSTMGLFDGAAEVALVIDGKAAPIDIAAARREIAGFGFETGYVVRIEAQEANVA